MAIMELGACEPFVYELRRSNLLERGQLDQLLEEFVRRYPQRDPESLASFFISNGVLTQFQLERIKKGQGTGLVLGPFVLLDAIGAGSMGTVHRALSKNDNKHYALKVLPRRSIWNVRLARRQVRTFGQFTHPAVVPFVDVGTAGGLHYLVWEFAEGERLDAFVNQRRKLDAGAVAQIGMQIASGMAAAQQNGIFHGLLKPSNVLVSSGPQMRILDFGIGSLLAENEGESLVDTMSTANTLTSGLDCASPESIMEPTNRTHAGDQYSLGCILYFCLAGRYPFPDGNAVEKMMAHQFKKPTPIAELAPDAPAELIAVVEQLLQKKPEDRFEGFEAIVEALSPIGNRLPSASFDKMAAQAVLDKPRPGQLNRKSNIPGLKPVSRIPGLPVSQSKLQGIPPTPIPAERPLAPLPRWSFHGTTPSLPAAPPIMPPATLLPTRQSLRGKNAPAQLAPQAPESPLMNPMQNPITPTDMADASRSKPVFGPIGLISIGALVALVSFFIFQQFMK
jgi:serine/threonine-protein kinase